ncbi:hypothetical protein JKP88DRAFT_261085 [Tribonema minus]|uniref:Fe2OG dioxygenase domain-containing protein n=1 Tax=Tribonema minus TaxID=303371 RepID=A0A835YYR1_9STRA|nr:hypothetical protein JKP88DRAFT_261085 [Tribonema minus]
MRGLAAVCSCAVFLARRSSAAEHRSPNAVSLQFNNEADVPVTLNWLNTFKGNKLIPQRDVPIQPKHGLGVDSFKGHSFVAVSTEVNMTHYDPINDRSPSAVHFTMSPWDDTVTITSNPYDGSLELHQTNSFKKVGASMEAAAEACKRKHKRKNAEALLDKELLDCMSNMLATEVAPKASHRCRKLKFIGYFEEDHELAKQRKMMDIVGDRLRNYTCVDPQMKTTEKALRTITWDGRKASVFLEEPDSKIILVDNFASEAECDALIAAGTRTLTTHIFLEEPDSSIMLIENFVSDKECDALIAAGERTLEVATVNGATGADLSISRRAKAGVASPKLSLAEGEDPITDLYRRGYRFANDQTGYDMPLDGQEKFSVIKYDATDEYIPHCDGDCTGAPYKPGGRIATMVVYCGAAEFGGGTTFSNVDVFINGKRGQAAFFAYYDKERNVTDSGRTRHSGCPIISGTKWIATLWMRNGVSKAKSYMHFDPEGRPVTDEWHKPPSRKTAEGGDASPASSADDDDDEEYTDEEYYEEDEDEDGESPWPADDPEEQEL